MRKQRMNLRLFDVMTTTTETLSAEMKIFYDDVLIDNAKPNLVHDQFGQKRPIPRMAVRRLNSDATRHCRRH